MRAPGIIVSLDILKYRQPQLVEGAVCPASCFFPLEVLEKAFTNGIVKGIPLFGKGLYHVQGVKKLPENGSGILGSPVRMEHKAIRGVPVFIGFMESGYDKADICVSR